MASVIKAGRARELPSMTAGNRVIKRQVYDAREQIGRLIDQAIAVAEQIVADAQSQRNSIVEEARQSGYEQGLQQWNEIVAQAIEAKEEYLAAAESDLLRLSVRIAGKIIGEQLRLAPETIASIVREALKSAPRERRLTIQVNPSDAAAVRQHLAKLLESVSFRPPEIEIAPVDSVAPGGCIIVSELGRVDAQLETQLQAMERVLLKARR